jgi:hypothetical protein
MGEVRPKFGTRRPWDFAFSHHLVLSPRVDDVLPSAVPNEPAP